MKHLTYILFVFILSCATPDKPIENKPKWFDIKVIDDFEDTANFTASATAEINATASPTTIVGNAEQFVTITGTGFGTEKPIVFFNQYAVQSFDMIIENSDTKIVTQVPIVNTGYYTVTVKPHNYLDNRILATANDVYAKWGVYQAYGNNNGKYIGNPFSFVDLNGKGGITFHCPIGTSESVKSTFRSALQYWTDKTGVNWELGDNVNAVTSDGADGIFMLGVEEGVGLARASVRFTSCGDGTFYASDGYAGFDSAPSLIVAKHELGHVLGNGHGLGVMCATTSCATSEASTATLEASAYIMNRSFNVGVSCYPLMTGGTVQPALTTWYIDNDNDGYGNPNISVQSLSKPLGYVSNNKDCNDSNANINPLATETPCNSVDENCDGRKLKPKCR